MVGNVTVMTINTTVTIYWGYVTRRDGLLIDGDDILSKSDNEKTKQKSSVMSPRTWQTEGK